jgi:hypothetical protein
VGFTSCDSLILIGVSTGVLLLGWLIRIGFSVMIILFIVFNTYVYRRIFVVVLWIIEFQSIYMCMSYSSSLFFLQYMSDQRFFEPLCKYLSKEYKILNYDLEEVMVCEGGLHH